MIHESRQVEDDDLTAGVDEEALHKLLQNMDDRMSTYAYKMNLDIANVVGCFEQSGLYSCFGGTRGNDDLGTEEDVSHLHQTYEVDWKAAYDQCKITWRSHESLETDEYNNERTLDVYSSFINPINTHGPQVVNNSVCDVCPASHPQVNDQSSANSSFQEVVSLEPLDFALSWGLNKEQTIAFHIITSQSLVCRGFENPLKMFLSGPAGTGKSCVFKALHAYFEAKGQSQRFRICTYMGVAAKNVGGMTLHAALCFGKNKKSNQSKEDLKSMWNGVNFLLINEVSMISCEFLIEISEALSDTKGNSSPFGGVNIIFGGDFAQLPPVLQT